jgi:hypothetical protein
MTLQLELLMKAGKLWVNSYEINDVVFNLKNPQKIYYRVLEMTHDITGSYIYFTVYYNRQIPYTGSFVPSNSPTFLLVGSLYDLRSITNQEATLFQQRPLIKCIYNAGFVPTDEKIELPLFMMRSYPEIATLVHFSMEWARGGSDIHSSHEGQSIQLKLQLYTA